MFLTTAFTHIFKQEKYLLLLDQALLSIINFGSILFLAKAVPVTVFGSFVVLYSYYLFIFLFLSSYISTPILVFLTKKWKKKEGGYLVSTLVMHATLCIGLTALAYFFLNQQVEGAPFLSFFLMAFSITFFDLLKKFVFSSKNIPVKYGLLSTLVLNVVFFYGLFSWNLNELSGILFIYWVSFFTANFFLLFFIVKKGVFKGLLGNFTRKKLSFFREVMTTHYQYAKWILIGGLAFWGYSQGIYILAKVFGINDFTIGKIRTIQNLLGVFSILAISIDNHFIPFFTERLRISTRARIFSLIRSVYLENYKKVLFLFFLAAPVGLVFYNLLYVDKYGEGTVVFFIFLFVQLMIIGLKPFAIVLKCIEKTKSFFVSHFLAVIGMVATLSCLVYFSDYYAMPVAVAVATTIYIFVLLIFFRRGLPKTKTKDPSP